MINRLVQKQQLDKGACGCPVGMDINVKIDKLILVNF